jgi:hypothetical protein
MTEPQNALRNQRTESEKHEVVHDEVVHRGHLSHEELEIAKKLRNKIDWRIMPLVILVYLMNYIDR